MVINQKDGERGTSQARQSLFGFWWQQQTKSRQSPSDVACLVPLSHAVLCLPESRWACWLLWERLQLLRRRCPDGRRAFHGKYSLTLPNNQFFSLLTLPSIHPSSTMSGITLVNQVKASKFLSGFLQPVANAFVNASGYRKLGASLPLALPCF
jgi:hypothetical protein